jgi:hypothetical protein
VHKAGFSRILYRKTNKEKILINSKNLDKNAVLRKKQIYHETESGA